MSKSPSPEALTVAAAPEPDSTPLKQTKDGPGPEFAAVPGLLRSRLNRQLPASADPLGGTVIPSGVLGALRRNHGRGQSLPEELSTVAGQALGIDLSPVRVHTDPEAATLARSMQAVAFTHGHDIYFSAGSYRPAEGDGKRLIAHELGHVGQAESSADGIIGRADDPAEAAADRAATSVVAALQRQASRVSAAQTDARTEDQRQGSAGGLTLARMVVRRYGGILGQPGIHKIGEGGMIWHGTDVAKFEDRSQGAKPGAVTKLPSPPAWFAGDPAFSAHVSAFMHPSPMTYMNAYTVRSGLNLLAFDNCQDLDAFLGPAAAQGVNDAAAAAGVLARSPGVDGYMLEQDQVREQPEYVLFAGGIAKLRFTEQLKFKEEETRWDQGPGDPPNRKHTFHGQPFGTLKGMDYVH